MAALPSATAPLGDKIKVPTLVFGEAGVTSSDVDKVVLPPVAAAVEAAARLAGLPTAVPPDLDPEHLVRLTRGDKKARGGRVEYALPAAVGRMAGEATGWGVRVPDDVVLAVLRETGGTR